MIPVQHLFEAHLTVTDLDRAVEFYRDVLGFSIGARRPGAGGRPHSSGSVLPVTRCWDCGGPGQARRGWRCTRRFARAWQMLSQHRLLCDLLASRRSTSTGSRPTSRGVRLDAGRVRLLHDPDVTCWSTSPCSQTRRTLNRASFRGEKESATSRLQSRPSPRTYAVQPLAITKRHMGVAWPPDAPGRGLDGFRPGRPDAKQG